ncbi:unnamed protein product [Ranitomeya imitator]|uniref:Maturase K n=1 Tax=Ranitomeya imitator TaxID=111125 RepID=A0ABN9LG74_9NEOB|nr:unnamed protein product [Ranitomeya imitator]
MHVRFRNQGYSELVLTESYQTHQNKLHYASNPIHFVHSFHAFCLLHKTICQHWHLLHEAHPDNPEFCQPFLSLNMRETTQPVKDRISNHKSMIRCRNLLLPIPYHFITHDHRISQLKFQVIE